jgi:hypothetical protein
MIGDRWGVTEGEVLRSYPCDELVASPVLQAWRGVDVRAPAAAVWAWVAQVRLAPYSYDYIDNHGRRSPRVLMALPEPRPGEPFTTSGGRARGRIVSVDPGQQLTGTIMGAFMSYVLVPHDGGTRLLLKVAMRAPRWAAPGLCVGDLIMARRQLLNLKHLAEVHHLQGTGLSRGPRDSSGPGELDGERPRRPLVERRVADQEPVVEDAVGHVHQHVEVRVSRELPGNPAALQQFAQRRSPDGGEVREHLRDMLIVLRFGDYLPEPVGIALIFQAREAVGEERRQVASERASLPFGDDNPRMARQGVGDHGALGRPPPVNRLPSHAGLLGDRVDRQGSRPGSAEQPEGGIEDRVLRRVVAPSARVRTAGSVTHDMTIST